MIKRPVDRALEAKLLILQQTRTSSSVGDGRPTERGEQGRHFALGPQGLRGLIIGEF